MRHVSSFMRIMKNFRKISVGYLKLDKNKDKTRLKEESTFPFSEVTLSDC